MYLKNTKQLNGFNKKVALLDIEPKKQVEMLNQMYKGKVKFSYGEESLMVSYLDPEITSLDLPETELFRDTSTILTYSAYIANNDNLVSIKFPKCMEKIDFGRLSWLSQLQRIFVWDTTELENLDALARNSKLEMLIIRKTDGGKAKVIRFK